MTLSGRATQWRPQRAYDEHVQAVRRRVRWGRKGAGSGSKEPDGGSGPAPARHGHPQDGIDMASTMSIWRARGAQDALPPAGRKGSTPAAARVSALATTPGRQRTGRRPDARSPADLTNRRMVVGGIHRPMAHQTCSTHGCKSGCRGSLDAHPSITAYSRVTLVCSRALSACWIGLL